MGLAASQARFLNLTARKTNLEYEGQQINQQRTTLANQSANTYNQMLTLKVPTPPSETAYQTIVYNFTNCGDSYSINQVTGSDNKATILATKTYVNPYAMTTSSQANITKKSDGYYYGTQTSSNKLVSIHDASDAGIQAVREDILAGMRAELKDNSIADTEIYYVNVSSDEKNPSYKYICIRNTETHKENDTFSKDQYQASSKTEYSQAILADSEITRDANNRIVAIKNETLGTSTISVTSTTIKDSAAYEDAYNEYEYQTYLYQQKMEQINAQTSIIQAQDKKLELRLKQLDTEQNAIKTEMESISSVVKENVEDTFKIFA